MKKILFALLLLLFLAPTPTHANTTLSKGAHVTSGVNSTLFNTLNNDVWMGDDSVIYDLNSGSNLATYGAINAELIWRVPFNTNGTVIGYLKTLPNFHCKFELLNEPDLGGSTYTPTYAASLVVADIAVIDANCPNAYVMLQLSSQSNFSVYSPQLWDTLPQSAKDRIDEVSWHFYPSPPHFVNGVFDPAATVSEIHYYNRHTVRPFMNARGIAVGSMTETGFDRGYFTQEQVQAIIPLLWEDSKTFAWLSKVLFYDNSFNGLNYIPLVNSPQTRLTPAGRSWRDLQ